jgi:hypothetical protein
VCNSKLQKAHMAKSLTCKKLYYSQSVCYGQMSPFGSIFFSWNKSISIAIFWSLVIHLSSCLKIYSWSMRE